jgi:succinoglycan biosynthesis transport protein ExoP
MDEELDLRAFFLTIARHWKLIAIIIFMAVVAGALAAFLWPPEYQATATVAVTKPRYVLDFDERLRSLSATTGSSLPLGVIATNAYTLLATNEELRSGVLRELSLGISLDELKKNMSIKADSGVIQFTGKGPSPERASQIANTWARLYADQLNTLFSSTAPNISALETEAGSARSALLQSEQALADFQARSQITSLEKQLEAASTALADRLALTDRLGMLAADARVLQSRLGSQEATAPTAASQFQTLIMEAQAVSPRLETPVQLQFSVDSSALSSMSAAELDLYLEAFAKGLDQRRQESDQEAQTLPAQISAIQEQLEAQSNEYDRLLLARDIARDTHESIARKLDEERLQAALEEPEVKVVGQAASPSEPVWPKPLLVIALALAGGLIVGLLAALLAESVRPRQA